MSTISPNQNPTIEGDADYKLFNGEYVKQQPYVEIGKVIRADAIRIKAGKLQRLFKGTTVNILPAGTTEVQEDRIVSTGRITKANYTDAIIRLDTELSSDKEEDYWVFIDEPSYGDISIKVHLDKESTTKKDKDNISAFLGENQLGELVNTEEESQVIISKNNGEWVLSATKGIKAFDTVEVSRGEEGIGIIKEQTFSILPRVII